MVHDMQIRVAGLIERCQDEIVLESTLLINDDLNTLFVRYDRWLKNSAAAKSPQHQQQQQQQQQQLAETPATTASQQVATTSLMTEVKKNVVFVNILSISVLPQTEASTAISYPNMDEPPPPSYEVSSVSSGVGQLIDLGTDITATPPDPSRQQQQQQQHGGDDIVADLARMGVTSQQAPTTSTVTTSLPPPAPVDEFDMFAQSRTAYGTSQQG